MRMVKSLIACLILGGIIVLAHTTASESDPNKITYTHPSPTPTMPACVTEDGSGQALCWWDAQRRGNGLGTSVVSGDCALVPDADGLRALCIGMHNTQSGADRVQECNNELEELNSELLAECYRNEVIEQ